MATGLSTKEGELFKMFLTSLQNGPSGTIDWLQQDKWRRTHDIAVLFALSKDVSSREAPGLITKWSLLHGQAAMFGKDLNSYVAFLQGLNDSISKERMSAFMRPTCPQPLLGLLWLAACNGVESKMLLELRSKLLMDAATARIILTSADTGFDNPSTTVRLFLCQAMMVVPWSEFPQEAAQVARLAITESDPVLQPAAWGALALQPSLDILKPELRNGGHFELKNGFETTNYAATSRLRRACRAVEMLDRCSAAACDCEASLARILDLKGTPADLRPAFQALLFHGFFSTALNSSSSKALLSQMRDPTTTGRYGQTVLDFPADVPLQADCTHDLSVVLQDDSIPYVDKWGVCKLLSHAGQQCFEEALTRLWATEADNSQTCFAYALRFVPGGEPSVEHVEKVIGMLDNVVSDIRREALFDTLKKLAGKLRPQQVKRLMAICTGALKDASTFNTIGRDCLQLLAVLGQFVKMEMLESIMPTVRDLLCKEDLDPLHRAEICRLLAAWGTIPPVVGCIPDLAKLLHSTDKEVRSAACLALGSLDAIPAVIEHIERLLDIACEDPDQQQAGGTAWSALLNLDVIHNGLATSQVHQRLKAMVSALQNFDIGPDPHVRTGPGFNTLRCGCLSALLCGEIGRLESLARQTIHANTAQSISGFFDDLRRLKKQQMLPTPTDPLMQGLIAVVSRELRDDGEQPPSRT